MKRILLLATGGTIASLQETNGLAPGIASAALIQALPGLNELCEVASRDLFHLDSSNIQPEEWRVMAEAIRDEFTRYDGFVITHGTDTMAYTAAALSFMLQGLGKPVILTGSQLPINHPLTDARINLLTAFTAACLDGFQGVHVAFDRRLIAGTRASKVRTLGFDAFESINAPPVAIMDSGFDPHRPDFTEWGRSLLANANTGSMSNAFDEAAPSDNTHGMRAPGSAPSPAFRFELDTRVFLLKLIPGTRTEFFDAFPAMGYKGLVIEAFGIGGLHSLRRNLVDKLGELVRQGIPVVVTSQCLYGRSDPSIYEVGRVAMAEGIIPVHDMTRESAVVKLMWVLGQTGDPDGIRSLMTRNLCGELH